ncbi:IDEAL domain-containing protein [Alkalihalobacillus sp. NPDC078783]
MAIESQFSYWAEVKIGTGKRNLGLVHEMNDGSLYFQSLFNIQKGQRGQRLTYSWSLYEAENTFELDVLDELIDFALDNKDERRFYELVHMKNKLGKVKLSRGTIDENEKWACEYEGGMKEMIVFLDKEPI